MECFIVDSFTDQAFKGNPAGVCLLNQDLPESRMQEIATELNFSETAFVKNISAQVYSIRYFSPKMEIPLCGHATLASAKVLFHLLDDDHIQFITIRKIKLEVDKKDQWIQMQFPVYDLEEYKPLSKEMLEAIGISEYNYIGYNKETDIIFLELEDCDKLQNLNPRFSDLAALPFKHMGISISAKSNNSEYDFYSRFFWPWSGSDEDPVTGGTHTFLTPYWSKKLGKKKMNSYQCSPRSGFMVVELIDNNSFYIRGKAVILFKGEFLTN